MANPSLVKPNWINTSDDVRIIDNNSRAEEKILAFQEEMLKRQSEAPSFDDGMYVEEFQEGLNPEQLEQLTADQPVYASPGDGELPEGYDPDDLPPDAGRIDPNLDAGVQPVRTAQPPQVSQQGAAQAEAMLQEASEQAQQIIEQAQAEAVQLRETARTEGYSAGFQEGRQQGVIEVTAQAEREYAEKLEQLDREYQRKLDEVEPEMVDVLTRIYEHVFDVNLRGEKSIILHLIQTTLSRVEPNGDFFIHISPADYDYAEEEKETLRASISNPNATMELIEDPLLNEGECMIETDGGIFDCSLGVELSELSRKLKLLAFDRRRN